MKTLFSIFAILLTNLVLFGQNSVIELPGDSANATEKYDFAYTLPKTAFLVEVSVIKTDYKEGIYADYAEELLGIKNEKRSSISYSLQSISVNNFLIPDNTHQYLVSLNSKEKAQFIEKYNTKRSMSDYLFTPFLDSTITKVPDFFRYFANSKYQEMQENYIETKVIDGVVTQIPINQTKTISKTPQQQAREAADQILKIRENRYQIIAASQEVPYSKEAIEYMIYSLNELEKSYLELFIGNSTMQQIEYTFVISPEDEKDLLIPIFAFSKEAGIQEAPATNKGIYYLKIEPQISFDKWENYQELQPKTNIKNNGYRIRQSLPAVLSLVEDNNEFKLLGIFYLYQLGKIETLPAKQNNFKIENWGFIF